MNSKARAAAFLLLVAIISVSACLLTGHWLGRDTRSLNEHEWVHDQLGLTPEQEKAIDILEQRFEARRLDLIERITLANRELAEAMMESKGPSNRVAAAVRKIHDAQAELQQATIDHVFDMKRDLRPEQYDKLLNLTADALYDLQH